MPVKIKKVVKKTVKKSVKKVVKKEAKVQKKVEKKVKTEIIPAVQLQANNFIYAVDAYKPIIGLFETERNKLLKETGVDEKQFDIEIIRRLKAQMAKSRKEILKEAGINKKFAAQSFKNRVDASIRKVKEFGRKLLKGQRCEYIDIILETLIFGVGLLKGILSSNLFVGVFSAGSGAVAAKKATVRGSAASAGTGGVAAPVAGANVVRKTATTTGGVAGGLILFRKSIPEIIIYSKRMRLFFQDVCKAVHKK
jgi:hypothetical protein